MHAGLDVRLLSGCAEPSVEVEIGRRGRHRDVPFWTAGHDLGQSLGVLGRTRQLRQQGRGSPSEVVMAAGQPNFNASDLADETVADDLRRSAERSLRTLPRARLPDARILLHGFDHSLL